MARRKGNSACGFSCRMNVFIVLSSLRFHPKCPTCVSCCQRMAVYRCGIRFFSTRAQCSTPPCTNKFHCPDPDTGLVMDRGCCPNLRVMVKSSLTSMMFYTFKSAIHLSTSRTNFDNLDLAFFMSSLLMSIILAVFKLA